MVYQPRFYRQWIRQSMPSYQVRYKETDLFIQSTQYLPELCLKTVKELRHTLDEHILQQPELATAWSAIDVPTDSPSVVHALADSARLANVGPMAAVAGLFAESVGKALQTDCDEVIVENGGDIFLSLRHDCTIGVYAGTSPFTGRIGIHIDAAQTPLGVCTSAGTVGPSHSLGRADAVIAFSHNTMLADAAATAIANRVITDKDLDAAIQWGRGIEGILGIVAIKDRKIGIWGQVQIVRCQGPTDS